MSAPPADPSRPIPLSIRRSRDGSTIIEGHARESGRGLADPAGLSPAQRRRRAWALVVLTLLAPGSAQYVAGNRGLGRIALRVWISTLLALACFGVLAAVRRSWFLSLVARSWFLGLCAVLLFAGAALWAFLFLDTIRLARLGRLAPPKARTVIASVTAVLMGITSGGMVLAGTYVLAGRDAVRSVFGGTLVKEPTNGRYNVLLLGGDSGASRTGTRPDTIMVASIEAATGKTVVLGFARETENIDFREGSVMKSLLPTGYDICDDPDDCLLNSIYTWATDNRSKFPADVADPGVHAMTDAVEWLSGLDVHYYAMVNLKGFEKMIDAVGGLTITVKQPVPIGGGVNLETGQKNPVTGYIQPGVRHMNGNTALWYARSREGASNNERMQRQRCVIDAMVRQLEPQSLLLHFRDIAEASGSVLQTDLPEADLGAFADLALKAKQQKMKSVNFIEPLMKPWDYDVEFVREKVSTTIAASEEDDTAVAGPATPTGGSSTPKPSATQRPTADDVTQECSA